MATISRATMMDSRVLRWTPTCAVPGGCGFVMQPTYFLLDHPLAIPTRCPRCLFMLDTHEVEDCLLAHWRAR